MIRMIVTFFWVGLLAPAPGTWGSLAALPAAWGLLRLGGPLLLVAGIVVVAFAGLWAVTEETREAADHDPSHVVIDEVAGQWIALLPVAFGAAHAGVPLAALWPGWIAAFVLFRLFDIWKPGPVGWADRLAGPFGVMLDDLIAGVLAAIAVALLGALAHGMLM